MNGGTSAGVRQSRFWKGGRFAPWLLVLLVLAIYLPGIAQLPLLDRDEPRFATAAREMMERDEWIVPTFNGHDRFDKPPLVYWLMRAGYAMVGVDELGARLPAVACMIGLVLLVWSTGRRWFGESEGFVAAFMLATSLQFFIHGRLAVADLPMVLCVAFACVALAELLIEPGTSTTRAWNPQWTWWGLWIALGLGFLAKGPIALLVPALALLLWRWVLWRKPLPWERLGVGRGLLLTTAIVAVWGIPALWATQGRFWEVGIGEHVIRRGLEKFNERSYHPLFYIGTACLSLFPWIIFAGLAALAARQNWDARRAWLASWLLAPYVIFTAYATQLPHYVLPGFPAFFLLLGTGGASVLRAAPWRRAVLVASLAVVGLALVVTVCLILRATLPAGLEPLRQTFLAVLIVCGGFLLVASAWWFQRMWPAMLGVVLVGTGAHCAGNGLRAVNPAVGMSEHWQGLPAGSRYLGWGFSEPSLVFYSGVKWSFPATPFELAKSIAEPGPIVIVVMESECDPLGFFTGRQRWQDQATPPGLAESAKCLQTFEGLNVGRFRWQRISIWARPEVTP
jgi:4-amino-4-deoxy-L-arabinose transferase-like glycosyltransferase